MRKEALIRKIELKIKQISARVKNLEVHAPVLKKDIASNFNHQIRHLNMEIKSLKGKIEKLKEENENAAFNMLHIVINNAIDELDQAIHKESDSVKKQEY